MVSVLIDTCVLSEIQKPSGDARVYAAVDRLPAEELFFSVITVGEIARGLALLPDGRRKESLISWLDEIVTEHKKRILPIDLEIAKIWGDLSAHNVRNGRNIADADQLIAATAVYYQMPVMTRNIRHFEANSVEIINPWED